MQNTEATQVSVHIEHNAYRERKTPSGIHSLCPIFPAKRSNQGMAFRDDAEPRRREGRPEPATKQ